jgi:uncharacterized protein (DUF885 family)
MADKDGVTRRALLTASCAGFLATATGRAQAPGRNIDDFFSAVTDDWVRHDPSLATRSNYFHGDEQDRLSRQITPRTLEWRLDRIARARKAQADLRKFDRSGMTDVQRVSAELLDWQLDMVIQEEPFLDYTFALEQMNGSNVSLVEYLTVSYPVANEKDAENYLAVLAQVSASLDEATAEAKRLAAKRIIPPRFILQATVKQMRGFIDGTPAQNPFVTAFGEKLASIKSLSPEKREALRAQAEKLVSAQVYPAWRRGIELLESQTSGATDDAGLWRLKGGDAAYAHFLRRFTTTNMTADQIHQIGLDHVKSLESQMEVLLRRLNRTQGTVKERIEKLSIDLRYPNPASEASRAQIMRDIDAILADAQKRAALLFDIQPKTPVVARPFPSFREKNAAANYNGPPPDGSRPGVFQYPRRIEKMTKFGLRSTVYHETIPGHHFQIALEAENREIPRFRQTRVFGGISALTEGWGLYAERLAAESGWYGDDAEGLLGQLDSELFRARRLVVDTGLHAKRWTRQRGIDFGIEASEVERYAVYPGQACSYMMGELKILESRERAKKALGDRFSLRKFHNKVLTTGMVPLELLEKQVDVWVKEQKA